MITIKIKRKSCWQLKEEEEADETSGFTFVKIDFSIISLIIQNESQPFAVHSNCIYATAKYINNFRDNFTKFREKKEFIFII